MFNVFSLTFFRQSEGCQLLTSKVAKTWFASFFNHCREGLESHLSSSLIDSMLVSMSSRLHGRANIAK